jgi:hypothetical protein
MVKKAKEVAHQYVKVLKNARITPSELEDTVDPAYELEKEDGQAFLADKVKARPDGRVKFYLDGEEKHSLEVD